MVKRIVISVFFSVFFLLSHSQNNIVKDSVFILFDKNNHENMKMLIDSIGNRTIFFIDKERFEYRNKLSNLDTLPVSFLKNKEILSINKLIEKEHSLTLSYAKKIERILGISFPKSTMYHDLFKVFIIVRMKDSCVIRYPVEWKFYIK